MSKKKTEDKKEIPGKDAKGRFLPGNLFALSLTNSGRPPKFDSAEEMAKKIADYLNWEDEQHRAGKGVYTLSGCALFLGFGSRDSMYDYEKKSPEFSDVINKFRLFMIHWNEQKLYWGGTYMAGQFWLRNHGGYTDETVNKSHQTIENVTIVEKQRDEKE